MGIESPSNGEVNRGRERYAVDAAFSANNLVSMQGPRHHGNSKLCQTLSDSVGSQLWLTFSEGITLMAEFSC